MIDYEFLEGFYRELLRQIEESIDKLVPDETRAGLEGLAGQPQGKKLEAMALLGHFVVRSYMDIIDASLTKRNNIKHIFTMNAAEEIIKQIGGAAKGLEEPNYIG